MEVLSAFLTFCIPGTYMGKYIPKSDTSRHESPTVDVNYSALFLKFYCSYLWYPSVVPEWGSCCYFQTSDWTFGYVNQSDLLLLHRSSVFAFICSVLSTGDHTDQACLTLLLPSRSAKHPSIASLHCRDSVGHQPNPASQYTRILPHVVSAHLLGWSFISFCNSDSSPC